MPDSSTDTWGMRCPTCGETVLNLTKEQHTPLTKVEAMCVKCFSMVKYAKKSAKVDALERIPKGQRTLMEGEPVAKTEAEDDQDESDLDEKKGRKRGKALAE